VLKETVDKAYEIFSKYRANRPLDVCTDDCCMKVEDEERLASLPVRQIPVELLTEYNDSAKPEKTRTEEIKHFLPRYLELISAFNFPTHSTELSLSRLIPFDKNEWTETELQLLETFSKEFFKHTLRTYPIPSFNDRIDSILIMFWRAEFNLERLLGIWEQTDTLESLLHFNDLYFHGFKEYNRSELFSGFGDKELSDRLTTWIENEKIKETFAYRIEKTILGGFQLEEQTITELDLLYEIIISRT
jgi:hypothetical protein